MTPYYQDEYAAIYHGDCRDVLAELPEASIDLLLTDPPYGQQFHGQGKLTQDANIRGDGARQGMRLVRAMLFEAERLLKSDGHLYTFCHWESWPDFYDAVSSYLPIKSALIWWKNRGGVGDTRMEYARDYEVILYGARNRRALRGRRDGAVIAGIPPVGNKRVHPTEKPLQLLSYLISKSSPEAGCVLDPFAGSGSTLRAAKGIGVRSIGVEIEERYCEIAARHLEAVEKVAS